MEVWYGGNRYNLLVPEAKKVVRVTIDPKKLYPDVRRENNVWRRETGDDRRGSGTRVATRRILRVQAQDDNECSIHSVVSCQRPLSMSLA